MIPRLNDEEVTSIYSKLASYGIYSNDSVGFQQIQIELQMRILDSIKELKDERK